MFRDEGTEPVIEFRRRMDHRISRTPTSIVVALLPVAIVARLSLIAHSYYMRSRCLSLARRIDPFTDLRARMAEPPRSAVIDEACAAVR